MQALFLFLPGYIANMMPVLFWRSKFLELLRQSIDGGLRFNREPLFGPHKTYAGFVMAVAGGLLTILLQAWLYATVPTLRWIFLFPYTLPGVLWWGFLLGFGALFGDLVKSFIKRRLHIKSGGVFFPFDQLDFVVGGLGFGSSYFIPSWTHIWILLLLTPLLHFMVNVIAYQLKLKHVWW